MILIIRKTDFDKLLAPISVKFESFFAQSQSPLEGLIRELGSWANVDQDLLLSSLADSRQEIFSVLAMKAVKVLKELASEKQKNKDKVKQLEVDKKFKELEMLHKKMSELDAKKGKEIEEKLAKLKEIGFDLSVPDKTSPTDKYVQEVVSKHSVEERKEIPLVDLFNKDEKTEEKI